MYIAPASKFFCLILLFVFWAFLGLLGRDAWRHEEALALEPILDWLDGQTSLWATPAPLHTLVAGSLAATGLAGIAPQDGARLASGVFALLALMFIGLTARSLFGPGFGLLAMLALQGAFGLMLLAHVLLPETALLAAWAALLHGIALGRASASANLGAMLIAVALISLTLGLRGLPDLLIGVLIVLLPMLSPAWRTHTYRHAVKLGLLLATLVIVGGLLALRFTGGLDAWLETHSFAAHWPLRSPWQAYEELAWFSWPLWPLALAAVWHEHRRLARATDLHMPLLSLVMLLAAALYPSWSRDGALLPVLLPLALLAAYALNILRRGAANAFYWFGVLCFLFFAFAFWFYFSAIEWGTPAHVAAHVSRLNPAYVPGSVATGSIAFAVALTLLWLIAIPLFPRARIRPILVWATGMTLVWGLIISLYRPWIEAGWGYRPLIAEMLEHLPADACLNVQGDPAMAVMLRYHARRQVRSDCPWTLLAVERGSVAPPTTDEILWEGLRPRQKSLSYQLRHAQP